MDDDAATRVAEAVARRRMRWKLVVMLGEVGPVDELAEQIGRLEPGLVVTVDDVVGTDLSVRFAEIRRRCEAWMKARGGNEG